MVAAVWSPRLYLFSIVIFDLFCSSEGKWNLPPSRSKWCRVRWGRISWPTDTHTLYPRFEYMCVCVFFHSAQARLLFPAFLPTIYFFYYSFQHFSLTLVTLMTNSSGCSFFLCLFWTPNAPQFRCAWASVIFLYLLFFFFIWGSIRNGALRG